MTIGHGTMRDRDLTNAKLQAEEDVGRVQGEDDSLKAPEGPFLESIDWQRMMFKPSHTTKLSITLRLVKKKEKRCHEFVGGPPPPRVLEKLGHGLHLHTCCGTRLCESSGRERNKNRTCSGMAYAAAVDDCMQRRA